MSDDFPVHWVEEIVEEIYSRKPDEITLSTGKTPSGHIHLGILREIIICDSLRRIFEKDEKIVNNLLFFDSLDAAKRFPPYIPKAFQNEHIGKPFALIPCPYENCNCKSYAHHFGNELVEVFPEFGIKTKIIWSHELYKTKKMQVKIKIALENTNIIKKTLRKYILPTLKEEDKEDFIEMQKNWMPVMAICEKCNRIQHRNNEESIKPPEFIQPIWSIYTTAYGRLLLYSAFEKVGFDNVYYCDTDSIITSKKMKEGEKLGELKLECMIKKGLIIKPKFYEIDGNVKAKGLRGFDKLDNLLKLIEEKTYSNIKFCKLKETLRRKENLRVNQVLKVTKKISFEDNKRDWNNLKFSVHELHDSNPLKVDTDGFENILI